MEETTIRMNLFIVVGQRKKTIDNICLIVFSFFYGCNAFCILLHALTQKSYFETVVFFLSKNHVCEFENYKIIQLVKIKLFSYQVFFIYYGQCYHQQKSNIKSKIAHYFISLKEKKQKMKKNVSIKSKLLITC